MHAKKEEAYFYVNCSKIHPYINCPLESNLPIYVRMDLCIIYTDFFIMNAVIDRSDSRISKRHVLITNEMWLIKHNLISEYSHILHFSWVKHMALSHTSCRQLRPKTCILWWMWKIFMAHSMCLKMVPWTRLAPAPPSPEQPLHGVPLYASIPYTLFNWWLTYLVWIKLQLNVWIILIIIDFRWSRTVQWQVSRLRLMILVWREWKL